MSAAITLDIYREQDPAFGEIFYVFPGIGSITPAGTGTITNSLESPNGYFVYTDADVNDGGSSAILFSFSEMVNELTNGLWTLHINKGLQTERQFQFSISLSGLTTNLLSAVKICPSPAVSVMVPPLS